MPAQKNYKARYSQSRGIKTKTNREKNMLRDDLKPRPNGMADDAMKSPCNKQRAREDIERQLEEFLRAGKINVLPASRERAESLRF